VAFEQGATAQALLPVEVQYGHPSDRRTAGSARDGVGDYPLLAPPNPRTTPAV
jgi:hypothetical protein